jgi:GTP-binding protein
VQTIPPFDAETLKKGERLFRGECTFIRGAQKPDDMPEQILPEIAFAGRSNVGKSSLINALTGRKGLARASNTPGRTQQINFFDLGGVMHLVDLPGYGYAAASKEKINAWNGLIRAYLKNRRTLKRVCVLIDSRHGIKASDQDTMEMLDAAGVAYVVVFTKCDKMKPDALHILKDRMEEELKSYQGAFPKIHETSASNFGGIPELRVMLTPE